MSCMPVLAREALRDYAAGESYNRNPRCVHAAAEYR